MDIKAIEEAIQTLENSDTTADNVSELASLYIVSKNLKTGSNQVINELNDILPVYNKFIEIKKKYQLGEISEDILIKYMKSVCQEMKELVITLYSGTDIWKERRCIKNLISDLYAKYVEEP